MKRIEKEKRMRQAKQNKEDEAKKKKEELEERMRKKEETSGTGTCFLVYHALLLCLSFSGLIRRFDGSFIEYLVGRFIVRQVINC